MAEDDEQARRELGRRIAQDAMPDSLRETVAEAAEMARQQLDWIGPMLPVVQDTASWVRAKQQESDDFYTNLAQSDELVAEALVPHNPVNTTNVILAEMRARLEQRDAEHKAELEQERRLRTEERDARLRAEGRERWMLWIAVVSAVVAVVSVVWTLTHSS